MNHTDDRCRHAPNFFHFFKSSFCLSPFYSSRVSFHSWQATTFAAPDHKVGRRSVGSCQTGPIRPPQISSSSTQWLGLLMLGRFAVAPRITKCEGWLTRSRRSDHPDHTVERSCIGSFHPNHSVEKMSGPTRPPHMHNSSSTQWLGLLMLRRLEKVTCLTTVWKGRLTNDEVASLTTKWKGRLTNEVASLTTRWKGRLTNEVASLTTKWKGRLTNTGSSHPNHLVERMSDIRTIRHPQHSSSATQWLGLFMLGRPAVAPLTTKWAGRLTNNRTAAPTPLSLRRRVSSRPDMSYVVGERDATGVHI